MWLLASGFAVHLILLCALFDIYFRTPIVTGITSEENPVPGPAKRVVLFIADGLRAESLYTINQKSTPYLRQIIEKDGSWGVSHTRVPTESRPGIVAIVGGIYEDPSAVFKGWKEYPVEFDTVLNQSRHTWAWGSPDVIHMFSKDHVETFSAQPQDFSSSESWQLDLWVFRSVEAFFNAAKENQNLSKLLHEDKIIFMLHLVGLDTAGHSVKPTSESYQENLQVVDSGVKQTVSIIETFYGNDGRTAYVFTADHGMTDWGSHGAGSKDETEVPIIAWGAGVFPPRPTEIMKQSSPGHWHLSHLTRADVEEADLAVLMAALIGCNIPVNSMGWIPIQYLDAPGKDKAMLAFYNARQLMKQADQKRESVHAGTLSWLYQPFPELTPEQEKQLLSNIDSYMNLEDYGAVVWHSKELADLATRALRYYHQYYQNALLLATSAAFLSWIAWLLHTIYVIPRFSKGVKIQRYRPWKNNYTTVPFGTIAFVLVVLIQAQSLPWQFNIYALLPVLLLWSLFRQGHLWLPVLLSASAWRVIVTFIFVVSFSIVMVLSFFHRWILSIGLLILSLWPLTSGKLRQVLTPNLRFAWIISSVILAIFPLLPVVGGKPSTIQVLLSGLAWLAAGTVMGPALDTGRCTNCAQVAVLLVAIANSIGVTSCIALGFGLPPICKVISWTVLSLSLVLPLLSEKTIPSRLLSLMLSVVAPYLLLSVKYEGLFLFALCVHITLWLLLESHTSQSKSKEVHTVMFSPPSVNETSQRAFSQEDFRRAIFFVFYIFLSFFGTGNIASLNSFDVTWVRCYIAVFSPFTMTALILFKILVPFLIVTSVFRAITTIVQAPMGHTFLAVLVACDLMGLQFLHLVTNEGSWLDIGSSISHYVIVQVTVLLLVVIYGIASILTGTELLNIMQNRQKKHHVKRKSIGTEPLIGHSRPRRNFEGLLPS